MFRRVMKFTMGAVVAAAFVVGGSALFDTVEAAGGGCLCPQIYAPVKCSNGKTYPNLCVATCQKAKNCVPTGGI